MWQTFRIPVFVTLACIAFVNADLSLAQSKDETLPKDQPQLPNLPGDFQKVIDSCGLCPAGKQREQVSGPYCGRCLSPSEFCGPGYHINNGLCSKCPCPSTNREQRFGISCRVDSDGQVTCDCPASHANPSCNNFHPKTECEVGSYLRNGQCLPCPCPSTEGERKFGYGCRLDSDGVVTCYCVEGHTGRDCSDCVSGYLQNKQYPYNCLKTVDGFNTRGSNSTSDNVDNSSHQNKLSGEFLLLVVVGAYSFIIAEIK